MKRNEKRTIKIGIVTFHASYNYGSMLQAYALQSTLQALGADVTIINYRSRIQRDIYALHPQDVAFLVKVKSMVRRVLFPSLKSKNKRFEQFTQHFRLTQVYENLDQIKRSCPDFDVYISGSDQIWNPNAPDFSEVYLLPFVAEDRTKIAYAASMGPIGRIPDEYKAVLSCMIGRYQAISVREEKSQEAVFKLVNRQVQIMPDPVLLLPMQKWDALLADTPIPKNKNYILLYTLYDDDDLDRLSKKVSCYLKMPVIITKYGNGSRYFSYMGYKRETSCGPIEFLQLLKNAKFVLSSSFHGTAFSIIFQRPFFAYRGTEDARIATLLRKTHLMNRAVSLENIDRKLEFAYKIDFADAQFAVEQEREKAICFLKESIGL